MMCHLYCSMYKLFNYKYVHIIKPNVLHLNFFIGLAVYRGSLLVLQCIDRGSLFVLQCIVAVYWSCSVSWQFKYDLTQSAVRV